MGRLQLVPAITSVADGITIVFVKSGWRRLARKSTFAPMAAWNAAIRRITGRGVHDMSGWLTSNWVSGCNFIFESSFGDAQRPSGRFPFCFHPLLSLTGELHFS